MQETDGAIPILPAERGEWMSAAFEPGVVSVIIPARNRADVLTDALDSVWSQTYRPIEIVVVDDGSTDGTERIVQQWAAAHTDGSAFCLRLLRQAHKGASAARNAALRVCRGEFVQFLDSDDLLLPGKLTAHVQALAADAEADLAYGPWYKERDDGGHISRHLPDLAAAPSPATMALRNLWTGSPLYHRRVIAATGPWNEQLLCRQDWEYNVRVMLHVRRAAFVPEPLVVWRRGRGDTIGRASRSGGAYLESRVQAIKCVKEILIKSGRMTPQALDSLYSSLLHRAADAVKAGQTDSARAILNEPVWEGSDAGLRRRHVALRRIAGMPGDLGRLWLRAQRILSRMRLWQVRA